MPDHDLLMIRTVMFCALLATMVPTMKIWKRQPMHECRYSSYQVASESTYGIADEVYDLSVQARA